MDEGLPKVVLTSSDGASAEICLHGAHVTSWRPIPDGQERLFLSARSAFREGVAIRGGIPVIFPQFAAEGPLPRHGFARTSTWTLMRSDVDPSGDAFAEFRLEDSESTRAIWPASFLLALVVRLSGNRLSVTLSIENKGAESFFFAAALHNYLRVSDIAATELVGLHGVPYRLSGSRDELTFENAETIHVSGEFDRVYVGAPNRLTLREPRRELHIETEGFADAVVWNPGEKAAAGLSDMEPAGERHFLCVEPAVIQTRIELDVGRRWSGSQIFIAQGREG